MSCCLAFNYFLMDWSERLITYETDSKMPPEALAEVFCSDKEISINHSPCAGTPSPGSSAPGTGFEQGTLQPGRQGTNWEQPS